MVIGVKSREGDDNDGGKDQHDPKNLARIQLAVGVSEDGQGLCDHQAGIG